MPHVVIVKRYDEPELYGLHTDKPTDFLRKDVFWAVGLFNDHDLRNKIDEREFRHINVEVDPHNFDLDKLISCAPIEWHSAMRQGDMLDRFQVFTSPANDNWHAQLLEATKENFS